MHECHQAKAQALAPRFRGEEPVLFLLKPGSSHSAMKMRSAPFSSLFLNAQSAAALIPARPNK